MRVLAAMSGGVDSSVAAARALAAGHEIVGMHLALSKDPQFVRAGSRGCCSLEDSGDVRRICDELGIPFYVWDFSERFKEEAMDDFYDSYERGETSNPCLCCNERIKLVVLLERGLAFGFDTVVIGHYALLGDDGLLRRGRDMKKDQSYVLGVSDHEQLSHPFLPIGDTEKPEIREEARNMELGTTNKPDSYDICLTPDGNIQAFLGAKIGRRLGLIVDKKTSDTVAEYDGVYGFTIGQRKGIGLPGPMADGKPHYATGIDADTAMVTIGTADDLDVNVLQADHAIWLANPDEVLVVSEAGKLQVQVRAHGRPIDRRIEMLVGPDGDVTGRGGTFRLHLSEPLHGVAPGQAAVSYHTGTAGDYVLGSDTIASTTWEEDLS